MSEPHVLFTKYWKTSWRHHDMWTLYTLLALYEGNPSVMQGLSFLCRLAGHAVEQTVELQTHRDAQVSSLWWCVEEHVSGTIPDTLNLVWYPASTDSWAHSHWRFILTQYQNPHGRAPKHFPKGQFPGARIYPRRGSTLRVLIRASLKAAMLRFISTCQPLVDMFYNFR